MDFVSGLLGTTVALHTTPLSSVMMIRGRRPLPAWPLILAGDAGCRIVEVLRFVPVGQSLHPTLSPHGRIEKLAAPLPPPRAGTSGPVRCT